MERYIEGRSYISDTCITDTYDTQQTRFPSPLCLHQMATTDRTGRSTVQRRLRYQLVTLKRF